MLVLTIKDNALVGFRNEENGYALKQNEQAATINGTVLVLPSGITHIGSLKEENILSFFEGDNAPGADDDWLLDSSVVADLNCITSIQLPSSLTTIKCGFFERFPNLESITFPSDSHIKDIYPRAFANCPNLEKVVIPDNADGEEVKIYVDAFVGCPNLKVIDVPENSSIHLASDEPFKGCDNLETLNLRGKAYKFPLIKKNIDKLSHGEDNIRINEVQTFGLARDNAHELEQVIEWNDEVGSIKHKLKTLTIPNSVTSIGKHAFVACEGLTSITIPNSVTSIGEQTFYRLQWINEYCNT